MPTSLTASVWLCSIPSAPSGDEHAAAARSRVDGLDGVGAPLGGIPAGQPRADLPAEGDRGEVGVAGQRPDGGRRHRPAVLAGEHRRGAGVDRGGGQVATVGGDRVEGGRGEPFGVLVGDEGAHPVLGGLFEQGGEAAAAGAVVGLDLVEEDVEGPAPLGRGLLARQRALQDVVDEEVGQQPVLVAGAGRAGQHDLALVHAAADVVAGARGAQQPLTALEEASRSMRLVAGVIASAAKLDAGLGGHGRQRAHPVVDLASAQGGSEAVNDRGDQRFGVPGGAVLHGEQVPAG